MKASQIINELKKHEELLSKDISDEDLEKIIAFTRSIDVDVLKRLSPEEIKQLNELTERIINKVKTIQTAIVKDIEKLEKNTDATKAYLKNEILNDR